MISTVDIHSDVPVYMQIENHITSAIASGKLKRGDRLPKVRDTATALGITTNTVMLAYRDLEMLGLVHGRKGIGVFVNKGVREKCRELRYGQIAHRLHEVTQEAKAAGWKRIDIAQVVNAEWGT